MARVAPANTPSASQERGLSLPQRSQHRVSSNREQTAIGLRRSECVRHGQRPVRFDVRQSRRHGDSSARHELSAGTNGSGIGPKSSRPVHSDGPSTARRSGTNSASVVCSAVAGDTLTANRTTRHARHCQKAPWQH